MIEQSWCKPATIEYTPSTISYVSRFDVHKMSNKQTPLNLSRKIDLFSVENNKKVIHSEEGDDSSNSSNRSNSSNSNQENGNFDSSSSESENEI